MIIDSHAHAWARWPYQPPVPDPDRRGCVEQLLWEMDQNGVDQAVLVAARIDDNPDNNEYTAAAVRRYPDRLHQFADVDCKWTADYHRPGAADRLRAAAGRYPLRGITHYLGPENDGWLVSDEGLAFFGAAAELGLIASIAGPPVWQADLRRVAARFPELPILCHHLAGLASWPGDKAAALAMVLPSAELPNILVKVSGFYYGAGAPWEYPHRPAIAIVRELHAAFGAGRLCWGSDYPVVRRALTYRQALECLRSHCDFIPSPELEQVLGGTLAALLSSPRSPR